MNVALIVVVALLILVPALSTVGYLAWASYRARQAEAKATDKERSISTDAATTAVAPTPHREESKEEPPRLRDLVIENLRKKRKLRRNDTESTSTAAVSVVEV